MVHYLSNYFYLIDGIVLILFLGKHCETKQQNDIGEEKPPSYTTNGSSPLLTSSRGMLLLETPQSVIVSKHI